MASYELGDKITLVKDDRKIEGTLVGSVNVPMIENENGKIALEDLLTRGWWLAK